MQEGFEQRSNLIGKRYNFNRVQTDGYKAIYMLRQRIPMEKKKKHVNANRGQTDGKEAQMMQLTPQIIYDSVNSSEPEQETYMI